MIILDNLALILTLHTLYIAVLQLILSLSSLTILVIEAINLSHKGLVWLQVFIPTTQKPRLVRD